MQIRHSFFLRGSQSPRCRRSSAFTLVELLVVMSMIALLVALLLPALASSRLAAQMVTCGTNLKQLGMGLSFYLYDGKERLPFWNPIGNSNNGADMRNRAWAGAGGSTGWDTTDSVQGLAALIGGSYNGTPAWSGPSYVGISGARRNDNYFCPGRIYHGNAYHDGFDRGRSDYVAGWTHFQVRFGSSTAPFVSGSNPATTTNPPVDITYRMTLDDFRDRWVRLGLTAPVGQRILAADYKEDANATGSNVHHAAFGSIPGASDVPHFSKANLLIADYSVRNVAMNSWRTQRNPYPDQTGGLSVSGWWQEAESKVPRR